MTFQVKTFERKPGHCMTGNNIQYEFFQIKPEILNAKSYYKYRLVLVSISIFIWKVSHSGEAHFTFPILFHLLVMLDLFFLLNFAAFYIHISINLFPLHRLLTVD